MQRYVPGCWLYLSGQQWVKKLEESNHTNEGVLYAGFKPWMPPYMPTGKPTRGRIQTTADLFQPKLAASRDFQGTCTHVFRLTVLKLRKEHSLCCS